MRFRRLIKTIESHTQGTPERIVVAGAPRVSGSTMIEKYRHMQEEFDGIRKFLVNEPRGHRNMCASILTEPVSEGADLGVIFLEPGGYPTMCGHGLIAICTALVETGLVPVSEPITALAIDTAAGLVQAHATVVDGQVTKVSITNVPSFVYEDEISVDVPGVGEVRGTISYGGNFYFIVEAADFGIELVPGNADDLILLGNKIWVAVNESREIIHPTQRAIRGISFVEFSAPPISRGADARNAVTSPPWNMDRSPCGTGTCAKMAMLHARGALALGQEFAHESILGGLFRGRLVGETSVGDYAAVLPTIEGSACISGFQEFLLDERDPFPEGFLLGRTEAMYGKSRARAEQRT